MTITNIQLIKVGDTDYQQKIEDGLNAIDNHDHSIGKGEPVKKLSSTIINTDNLELNGSNKMRVKTGSLGLNKLGGGVAPVGAVVAYVGDSAPNGWLLCHGQQVSQSTYSRLFAVIGEAWGAKVGSSTFALPDMRGVFLRGRDRAVGNDPDRLTRTALVAGGSTGDNVGSYQDDEVKQHTHSGNLTGTATTPRGYNNTGEASFSGSAHSDTYTGGNTVTGTTGLTGGTYKEGTANTNESRPTNVAVNYIIKY